MIRQEDGQLVRITREVPLWSIITAGVALTASAVALQLTQLQILEKVREQGETIRTLSVQVLQLSSDLTKANSKAEIADLRINDLDRRLRNIEVPQLARKER
jgi:hypothetical protein